MRGAVTPLPLSVLLAWRFVKHRDNFYLYHVQFRSRDNLVNSVTRLRAGRPRFDTRQGHGIRFITAPTPALGPIQWVLNVISTGAEQPGIENILNAWNYMYLHYPIRLQGVVLC